MPRKKIFKALVKNSSHKLCLKSSILTSAKKSNLLFYINIMEIKENNQVVSWTGR